MWRLLIFIVVGLAAGAYAMTPTSVAPAEPGLAYRGAADASAATFIDDTTLVVADDEDNLLRFYPGGAGGGPSFTLDLSEFLGLAADEESDLEGAARIGTRIYWITSHGRNREGKLRPERGRLFATEITRTEGGATLRPYGRPLRTLVPALVQSLEAQGIPLAAAAGIDAQGQVIREDRRLAPKSAGLNIEGLAACPDGSCLYIGLRNPRHTVKGVEHAIVVPLLNPAAVVDANDPPRLGRALLWNLGGQGVRSMLWVPALSSFLVVAGDSDAGGESRLYRWSGAAETQPVAAQPSSPWPADFNPEALALVPGTSRVLALSDDGDRPLRVDSAGNCKRGEFRKDGTCRNKDLRDAGRKSFRGVQFTP